MIKDYKKQKVKATTLLLLSIFIFGFFLQTLSGLWILNIGGFYLPYGARYSLVLLKISRVTHQHFMSIYIAFILLIMFSILLVWVYLNKESTREIKKILNIPYILLFAIAIILFLKEIIVQFQYFSHFNNPAPIFLLLIFIESIWKFSKKSITRKYFNSLFFIFISFFWIENAVVDPKIWGIGIDGILALFFYLISLIIAAAKFYRSRPKQNFPMSFKEIRSKMSNENSNQT